MFRPPLGGLFRFGVRPDAKWLLRHARLDDFGGGHTWASVARITLAAKANPREQRVRAVNGTDQRTSLFERLRADVGR